MRDFVIVSLCLGEKEEEEATIFLKGISTVQEEEEEEDIPLEKIKEQLEKLMGRHLLSRRGREDLS